MNNEICLRNYRCCQVFVSNNGITNNLYCLIKVSEIQRSFYFMFFYHIIIAECGERKIASKHQACML